MIDVWFMHDLCMRLMNICSMVEMCRSCISYEFIMNDWVICRMFCKLEYYFM